MRTLWLSLLLTFAGLSVGQPLPATATIAGSRFGALDIDVHPSGDYVAVAVSNGASNWWIYQFETDYGQLVKKIPVPSTPHQVRYSPDGFWVVVSYGAGNCDIYRTPSWDFYASIRKNSGQYGYAQFDGVSRHLGIEGELIYRMSDLQPIALTKQGKWYQFLTFIGLEAWINLEPGFKKLIETETLDELGSFAISPPSVSPHRSGIYAHDYPTLVFHEYDVYQLRNTRSYDSGRTGLSNLRMSPTGEFVTYSRTVEPHTLGILGFDPEWFSVNDYFGYSGHLPTGDAKGAVFAPPNWQLGDVRVASMTRGGDAGWLKMPEKWLLLDFLHHVGTVTQATSPVDPRELAVGAHLGETTRKGIRIWILPDSGRPELKKVLNTKDTVERLYYFDEGKMLAAVHPRSIEIWDLAGSGALPLGTLELGSIQRGTSYANNQICVSFQDSLLLVDLQTLTHRTLGNGLSNLSGAFLSRDGQKVAVCTGLGPVTIRSTSDFSLLKQFDLGSRGFSNVIWSLDGSHIYVGSAENGGGNAYVTRVPLTKGKGNKVIEVSFSGENYPFLELAPDGAGISAYRAFGKTLRLLDPVTLATLRVYDQDVNGLGSPSGVSYFAGGKRMSVATLDGPIGIMPNPVASKNSNRRR